MRVFEKSGDFFGKIFFEPLWLRKNEGWERDYRFDERQPTKKHGALRLVFTKVRVGGIFMGGLGLRAPHAALSPGAGGGDKRRLRQVLRT